MADAAILHCWLLRPGRTGQGGRRKGPCVRHRCGMVQSGAGRAVSLLPSGDGDSGEFPSSVESGLRGVLGEGKGLGPVRSLLRNREAGLGGFSRTPLMKVRRAAEA